MMSEKLKVLLEQYNALKKISFNNTIGTDMKEIAYKIYDEVIKNNLTTEETYLLNDIYVDMHIIYKLHQQTSQSKPNTRTFSKKTTSKGL